MERLGVTTDTAKEFGKFLAVGLINTALTLLIIFVLLWLGTPLLIANISGYGAGFVNSFIWNRRWTFRSTGVLWRETVVYSVVWLSCYLLQMGALLLLSRGFGLSDTISTFIAMFFFTGPNYLGNRYFTFKKQKLTAGDL
ncbi:MAG TPA: GtrA family protein [bacterium]|nr:GtrA family protein [bacterium]